MYFVGNTNDSVYEYTLSTAFNISTASFVQSFSVAAQDNTPIGLIFNNDGTKMYVLGIDNKSVYEYILGAAFNISSAVFNESFSVAAQDTSPIDLAFNNDGTKMYFVGNTNDAVYEYAVFEKIGDPTDAGDNDYLKLK